MKRLFLLAVASAVVSAWGQSGRSTTDKVSNGPTTVIVQGADGRTHEFQVPESVGQLEARIKPSRPEVVSGDGELLQSVQEGCPVRIEEASFERAGRIMLTSERDAVSSPTLHLDYRNLSGKEIESVELTGWIKVKESRYQLDYSVHPLHWEVSLKAPLSEDAEGTRAFKLASNVFGLDRIELSSVTYSDGSMWKPEHKSCVYYPSGTLERAAR